MNSVTGEFSLGFTDDDSLQIAYAKQFDTERYLTFHLVDGFGSYFVDDGVTLVFKEQYSDGTILLPQILDYTLSDDKTAITFKLAPEMLAVSGVAYCELSLVEGLDDAEIVVDSEGNIVNENYKQLTTRTFRILIDPSVAKDGSSYITPDTDITNLVLYLEEKATEDTARLDAIESQLTWQDM